jgi:hypothetical protein
MRGGGKGRGGGRGGGMGGKDRAVHNIHMISFQFHLTVYAYRLNFYFIFHLRCRQSVAKFIVTRIPLKLSIS